MTRIPMSHRGRRPRFFPAQGMDELVSMVIELTSEVWVLKERMQLLEKVAAAQGVELTAGIDAYAPSPEEKAALAAERERLIANVLRSLEAEFGDVTEAYADDVAAAGSPAASSEAA